MGSLEQGCNGDLLAIAGVEGEVVPHKRQGEASPLFGNGPGVWDGCKFAATGARLSVFARTAAGENAKAYPIEDGMLELEKGSGMRLAGFPSGTVEGLKHGPSVRNTLGVRLLPLLTGMNDISEKGKKAGGFGMRIREELNWEVGDGAEIRGRSVHVIGQGLGLEQIASESV